VVSIALLTTMTVATGVGALAEASGDAFAAAALASSVLPSDCEPEEPFDFLAGPDAVESVGSPFCAFAAAAAAAAAAVVATVVAAPGSALGWGALACADCGSAGAFGSAALGSVAFGSELAVAPPVFGVCEAGAAALPTPAFADEELVLAFPGADAPDVELDWLAPLPFWVVAPEVSVPPDFPAGCGGADGVPPAAFELLELPLLASVCEALAGPGVAPAVCCWAGDGLAEACGDGPLAWIGALAASSTANGLVSIWPWADGAVGSEGDETAVEALCAILGTLGTGGDSGSDNNNDGLLATGRPPPLSE
jgi:hypothetical protein